MNLASTATQILNSLRPFVALVALLFGFLAAWLAIVDLFPFLGQIWRPKGEAQRFAIIGAALAIVTGRT